MMVVEEIKFNKFFLSLLLILTIINFSYANQDLNKECFDILMDKNSDLDVNYDDYKKSISKSDYYPHLKPWDGLYLKDEIVFLKFYEYGQKTSFVYDLSDIEQKRYNSLNWPNNYEYMFFEMYILNPNTNINGFAGCGYINTNSVSPYNLNNIYGEDFWGCPGNESISTYEELDNWFFRRAQNNNCFNFNNEPFISFNVDRVYYNDENLYINMYEVIKNTALLRERYINSNYEVFEDVLYKKLYNSYPDLGSHLVKGFLPISWVYQNYDNINYHILKQNIDILTYPGVLKSKELSGDFQNDYKRELFISLSKEKFENFLYELIKLDSSFELNIFRSIETNCLNLSDVSCIGEGLTNYFLKYSDDVNAINFFVDSILSQENSFYNFNDFGEIDDIIENEYLIFGERKSKNIVSGSENILNKNQNLNMYLNFKIFGFIISIFAIISLILIIYLVLRRKNEKK